MQQPVRCTMTLKRNTAGEGQQACCVLWGESQSMREQSRQHPGCEHAPLLRGQQRQGGWLRVGSALNPSRPCPPCFQPSLEGQRRHFANSLAYALLPLPVRKQRQRRNHYHPQSLMRVNKQFMTSCQNASKPPSCSYKIFLVRHPAARILGEPCSIFNF